MRRHVKYECSTKRKFICRCCEKRFNYKYILKQHCKTKSECSEGMFPRVLRMPLSDSKLFER